MVKKLEVSIERISNVVVVSIEYEGDATAIQQAFKKEFCLFKEWFGKNGVYADRAETDSLGFKKYVNFDNPKYITFSFIWDCDKLSRCWRMPYKTEDGAKTVAKQIYDYVCAAKDTINLVKSGRIDLGLLGKDKYVIKLV